MKFLRDYSLSLALAVLFLLSWVLQTLTGWVHFVAEQESHGETPELFGTSGYFWQWMQSTFENWQSEFLQLFTMVVLVSFLIHRGSQQSKDSDEEIKAALEDIEERLYSMELAMDSQPKARAKPGKKDS
jgi:DNA-binding transcriptional regulator GbsR (MarR family)